MSKKFDDPVEPLLRKDSNPDVPPYEYKYWPHNLLSNWALILLYIPDKTAYWFDKYYAEQMGMSLSQWSTVCSVSMALMNVCFLVYALFLKVPSNILQFICLMLAGVCLLLCVIPIPIMRNMWVMTILRGTFLSTQTLVQVVMYATISKWANKKDSGRMMGVLGSSWPLSTLFFIPCAYVLSAFGWQYIYISCALICFMMGYVLFYLYPTPQQEPKEVIIQEPEESMGGTLMEPELEKSTLLMSPSSDGGDDSSANKQHENKDNGNENDRDHPNNPSMMKEIVFALSKIEFKNHWSLAKELLSHYNCVLLYTSACFPRMVPFIVQTIIPLWFTEQYGYSIHAIGWSALTLCAGELTAVVLNVWVLKSQDAAANVLWNQVYWALLNAIAMIMVIFWTGDYLLGPAFAMCYLYLTFVFWEQTFVMNTQLLQQTVPNTESVDMIKMHTQLYFFFCQSVSSLGIFLGLFLWDIGGLLAITTTCFLFEAASCVGFWKLWQRLK